MKSKLHQTLVLPVVLYGCETWSVTLREERRLREFENSVLREILGPKRKGQDTAENYITRSFMLCIPHQILFGWSN